MTIKQLIKNLSNPINVSYWIQYKLTKLINPDKEQLVQKATYYAYQHPECFENNACSHCGCSFEGIIMSNKQCELIDNKLNTNNND